METKNLDSILNRKAIISWFYLLLAIGVMFATLWPNTPLYFIQSEWITRGYMHSYYEDSVTLCSLGLWLCAGFYLMHFVYGAFYFPWKYKQALKMDPEVHFDASADNSMFRGLLVGTACAVIFCIQLYGHFSVTHMIIAVSVWALLHIGLILATRTNHLFTLSYLTVDLNILMPWEYPTEEGEQHKYGDIYFLFPASENEESYGAKFIKEYVKDRKRRWYEKYYTKDELKQIQEFSEQLAREIS